MALTITTTITPTGGFSTATPEQLRQKALERSDVSPGQFEVVGITVPRTQNDTSGLQTETRNGFFRTTGGTLHLNLVQDVFISSALSRCAQTVVWQHEQGHVKDNEGVMPHMDQALRADEQFNLIMVQGMDFPVSQLNQVKQTVQERIEAVFSRLTVAKVRTRDTTWEYNRMNSQMTTQCTGAASKYLQVGSVGHGVAEVQMALNGNPTPGVAILQVDGIFGQKTKAAVIAFQKRNGLKPDGIVGPLTRQKLGLPAV